MKKALFILASLLLMFACTPEVDNPSGTEEPVSDNDKTVHVTDISLDRLTATIKEGEQITLIATVTPDNANNKAVLWSSSSDLVATVDASGKVTGVKAGSVTITAIAEDGGMRAACSISVEANLAPSVTVDANHISAVSAVLAGKANLGSTVAADLQVGFQYSTSAEILPSNTTTIEATDADADYNYSCGITGLEPSTAYYFRSFVRQNGQYTYGEKKCFTTNSLESLLETMDATSVEATTATLNAKMNLTDVQYLSIEYGFTWGGSNGIIAQSNNLADNAFSATMTNLSDGTQYFYKAYVKINGQFFYGKVKSFTTKVLVNSVSLDRTEYTFKTIGDSITLKATIRPVDATDGSIEWTSTNESVAIVDNNGKVTAISNGMTTIKAAASDGSGKYATCEVTVKQMITSISLDKEWLSLEIGEEAMLSVASINPDNANDKSYTWSSSNDKIATVDNSGKVTARSKGNTTIKATANDGSGVFAACQVIVYTIEEPQAVDMGTVVNGKNIKWASFNIGASSPNESGLYYAWGETEPKPCYVWTTHEWNNGTTLTKYNGEDNKTELDAEDDVAHVKLGGNWRMPTDAEWTALITNCSWRWTTKGSTKGMIVTSSNGNSIFLPAAGCYSEYYNNCYGGMGYYWSSSISSVAYFRAFVIIFSSTSDQVLSDSRSRCFGMSVRPVSE